MKKYRNLNIRLTVEEYDKLKAITEMAVIVNDINSPSISKMFRLVVLSRYFHEAIEGVEKRNNERLEEFKQY